MLTSQKGHLIENTFQQKSPFENNAMFNVIIHNKITCAPVAPAAVAQKVATVLAHKLPKCTL